jgi:hypothetical protein
MPAKFGQVLLGAKDSSSRPLIKKPPGYHYAGFLAGATYLILGSRRLTIGTRDITIA